ncbi:trans-sialidase [Trypanosoma conorhini]|uniref:Trans-sialidase n=1 Tax=Trypanosoma conorhini TaxID=83891 RepID=A0A3R7RYH7_9TRYP|nr:trans-sialidase [Trypanosoma conorhini]RNF15817.1 trans-sialidase [Trypanosoma conorhini]
MSRRLFSSAVLLLLCCVLICCGGCGAETNAAKTQETSREVELFKPGETPVFAAGEEGESSSLYGSVSSFLSHSLLDVKGVMVALAIGEHGSGDSNARPGIWAKYSAYGADVKLKEDAAWEGKAWKTQLVTKRPEEEGYRVLPPGPKAVVKDNKIHLLVSAVTKARISLGEVHWGLALIVGEVHGPGEGREEQGVSWSKPRRWIP